MTRADLLLNAACNWLADHPRVTAIVIATLVLMAGNIEGARI
jgi:hypothetical protein